MASQLSESQLSIETKSQIESFKQIIYDQHATIIKDQADIIFKKKHFIIINNPDDSSQLYHFKYTISKHKLDMIISIQPKENDYLTFNLNIDFNTTFSNYYLHDSFIKFINSILDKSSTTTHNILKNTETYSINMNILKDEEEEVVVWNDFVNILNDYVLGFDNRCFISGQTDVPLFQPDPEFNPLLVINENYIDEYNTLFIQDNKLTNFIENNPEVFQLINILIKTVFLSKRFDIIFDEPEFFKYLGKEESKTEVLEFIKKWDTLKNYKSQKKFKEYKFYIEYPIFYRTYRYYINKLSKYSFRKCDIGEKYEKEDCTVLELNSSFADEYESKFKTHKNDYAFHGSIPENWGSIMKNGLKPGNAKKGTLINANVYGAGIYLSDSPQFSYTYSTGTHSRKVTMSTSDYYIMGVYQVLQPLQTYKKAPRIYVVPDAREVQLKYLFIMKNTVNRLKVIDMISKQFSSTKLKQTAQDKQDLSSKINNGRLKKEYEQIVNPKNIIEREESGLFIEPNFNPKTMDVWRFKFLKENIPTETTLFKQLTSKNIDFIDFEIRFKERYPFEAPFVRIVHPKFKELTGHITSGGSICTELLSPSGWTPIIKIEKLLFDIKQLIIDGNAELDMKNYDNKYKLEEAQKAFKRMLQTHREWQ